jgi:hypothetical protein
MPQWVKPWNTGNKSPTAVPATLGTSPQWVRVGTLTFGSFSTAATTNSIALFNLPPAAILHGVKIQHSVAFAGGGITAYTVSVGDVGNATLYASAFNVFQAAGATIYQLSSDFGGESLVAATQLYATATSTGGNLSTATAGAVNIWALLSVAQ